MFDNGNVKGGFINIIINMIIKVYLESVIILEISVSENRFILVGCFFYFVLWVVLRVWFLFS